MPSTPTIVTMPDEGRLHFSLRAASFGDLQTEATAMIEAFLGHPITDNWFWSFEVSLVAARDGAGRPLPAIGEWQADVEARYVG